MTKRQLQAAVQAARAGRLRARLSVDLKAALGAHCLQRRASGTPWAELAADFGVGKHQLRQWSAAGSSNGSKLRRVRVISAPSTASTGLCLELPGSARVTGLSVADIAALLRELR